MEDCLNESLVTINALANLGLPRKLRSLLIVGDDATSLLLLCILFISLLCFFVSIIDFPFSLLARSSRHNITRILASAKREEAKKGRIPSILPESTLKGKVVEVYKDPKSQGLVRPSKLVINEVGEKRSPKKSSKVKLMNPGLPINFGGMSVYAKVKNEKLVSATSPKKEEIMAEGDKEGFVEKDQIGSPVSKDPPSSLNQLFKEVAQDSPFGDIIQLIESLAPLVPFSDVPAASANPPLSSNPKAANGSVADPLVGNEGSQSISKEYIHGYNDNF
ncbi:uncharacterized protein G2W53_035191 [Senna tora]|uniref:Uncharacterized protein n=1 Tax=Senna tora TaxID=362788 RepID=A0A834SPP0_9FABA|nr:uncharacterized protein G2W53_035191 [Senna tora]